MKGTVKVDFLADLLVYEKVDRKAVVMAVSRVASMASERVVWMVLYRVVSKDFYQAFWMAGKMVPAGAEALAAYLAILLALSKVDSMVS